jgi:hypothetical protein
MNKRKIVVILEYVVVLLVAVFIFSPILYKLVLLTPTSDYPTHTQWAQNLIENPSLIPIYIFAHTGWQVIVAVSHLVFSTSWGITALLVTLCSLLLTVGLLYWIFRKNLNAWPSAILAIGLNIAAPLAFWILKDSQYYYGYIWSSLYHNPTYLLLKPFAILTFYFSVEALQNEKANWFKILLVGLVSAYGAFVKPNYLVCLLPALAILALIRLLKKQPINWRYLIFGIVLPQILILGWQFWLTYSATSPDDNKIIFAPFAVMEFYSKDILVKYFLSIAFPVIVTAFYWKESLKDVRMQISWLGFFFGSFFTYFLAESGERFAHGNYLWSGEISIFILLISCVVMLSEKGFSHKSQAAKWIILISGNLSLMFGGMYYFYLMMR